MSVKGKRREKLTSQAEDYLKALHTLEFNDPKVSTQALADHLEVAPASVTGMLKKLSELGLVTHAPYQGACLTDSGQKIALELLRHHRLLELYLHQALGYPLENVHAEAERLEHHISEEFEARIFAILGAPTHDPHGDPIPTLEGQLPPSASRPISEMFVGEIASLGRIAEHKPEFLKHLVLLGLTPGAQLKILEVSLPAGTVTLEVDGVAVHTLSLEAARQLFVFDQEVLK
jgi:DtxR family transcriptional regulator, Mn-dependent transcriptional regulator